MVARRRLSVAFVAFVAVSVAFLGSVLPAAPAKADHDAVAWSAPWGITFSLRSDLFPSTFTDHDGGLYFAWYDRNNANGQTNVTLAKYATRGVFGNPQFLFQRQVNPTLPNVALPWNYYGFGWAPSVAMDFSGNLYVAWADTNYNVYVSKSVDGGDSWGAPSRVDPVGPNSYDSGPVIVAAPSGTLFVAWLQFWLPGGSHNVTVARSLDQGVTWGNKVNVTSSSAFGYWSHGMAVDLSGRLHLTYTSTGSFPDWHVVYTWSDTGSAWDLPSKLDGGVWGIFPAIAADRSDRIHVVWYDGRQSTSGINTYWYRRTDDRGATWTMEMPVSQGRFVTGFVGLPCIAVEGDTVIAGWSAYDGATQSLGYAISADGGDLWYPEAFADLRTNAYAPLVAADENGTFYAGFYRWNEFLGSYDVGYTIWDGPPSAPVISGIVRGSSSLDVSWSAAPEGDIAGYRLWRSTDGVTYDLVTTVDASTLAYTDGGLSNGTYWYRVTSFDVRGTSSHASAAMSATVGKTTAEMIADLEAQIAAIDAALDSAQADITAIQAQLDSLQTQLNNLQSSTDTRYADLQDRIDALRDRLDRIEAEKATQTQSYLLMVLVIIVIALLVMVLMQVRRISSMSIPRSMRMPPRESPPTMPREPAQPPEPPRSPEDEL